MMWGTKESFQRAFPTGKLHVLAGLLYEAAHMSQYWGAGGALYIAEQIIDLLWEDLDDRKESLADILGISVNFAASNSAYSVWCKHIFYVHMLGRALFHAWEALRAADYFLETRARRREVEEIFSDLDISSLEVLISPYIAAAYIGRFFPLVVSPFRRRALWLSRLTLLAKKAHEETAPYRLIQAKLALITSNLSEKDTLSASVVLGMDSVALSNVDKARLCTLLGERDKARGFANTTQFQDLQNKAGNL